MPCGMTMEELAADIMRQKESKTDYIVYAHDMRMEPCGGCLILHVLDGSSIDRVEPLDTSDIAGIVQVEEWTDANLLCDHPLLVQNNDYVDDIDPEEWKSPYNSLRCGLNENSWFGEQDSSAMLIHMVEVNMPMDDIVFFEVMTTLMLGGELPEMYEYIKNGEIHKT